MTSKHKPKQTNKRTQRIGVFMLIAGLALVLAWVGLLIFESSLTKKSEGNRFALEAGRTPLNFSGELHVAESEALPADEVVPEETIRPLEPVVDAGEVVLDEYSVIPVVEKKPVADEQVIEDQTTDEHGYAFGEELDQETLDWYAEIRAQYPDFKGWGGDALLGGQLSDLRE